MKNILAFFLTAVSLSVAAQEMPENIDLGRQNPYPFLTSTLLEVCESANRNKESGLSLAKSKSMPLLEGKIYVEIVNGSVTDMEKSVDTDYLRNSLNLQVTTSYKNRASAWVSPGDLVAIGNKLPPGYSIHEVTLLSEDNQGPGLMNSDNYQGESTGGDDIRIAIIDIGFDRLTEARNAGEAPPLSQCTFFNYTGSSLESSSRHGTACVETIYDHAPNAEFFIMKVFGSADLGEAVEECIDQGVDIISLSLAYFNTGWGDNTGAACAAAEEAADNGILFFTAAGNYHGTHWQGNFDDPDDDHWHNWSGSDEQNNFSVSSGGTVQIFMQWNSVSIADHYDLYLYDNVTGDLLAFSANTFGFESLNYTNTTDQARNVYVAVRAKTTDPPAFELFNTGNGCSDFQYISSTGSSTSPSNSTASNVVSVGAVPRNDYDEPEGTSGIIASYSSRGPTNSGNQAPDICAPTNTTTVAYSGDFSGTSCATPNAAGAAAAFWSAHPQLNATGVRQILFAKANLYKDWGANGSDNIYGRGGLFLYDYHAANRYILASANNPNSSPSLPYNSIEEVENDAIVPENRRMIYLNSTDLIPVGGMVFNKPMLYKSIRGTVIRPGTFVAPPENFTIVPEENPVIATDEWEASPAERSAASAEIGSGDGKFTMAPNPVKSRAIVFYEVAIPAGVDITIFDIAGHPVQNLANTSEHAAGKFQIEFDGSQLPPGVYLCRLLLGKEAKQLRLVVAP